MHQPLAIVFPGQGSQSVGMLSALAERTPVIQQTFAEASEVLGYDLWTLTQNGPIEKLSQTTYTQPALLAASVALWRLYCEKSPLKPRFLAGHSLGEYSALVCAKSLSFLEAIPLVALRAKLMQEALPEGVGSMAAILGLEGGIVESICQHITEQTPDECVVAANYNTVGQIVISGHTSAVSRAITAADAAGAKRCIRLAVSVASHSPLMQEAALKLATALEKIDFKTPEIPIIHNADCLEHYSSQAIRQSLVDQLYKPVHWLKTIRLIFTAGVHLFYECGPGTVLCALNKRIDPNIRCYGLSNRETLDVV